MTEYTTVGQVKEAIRDHEGMAMKARLEHREHTQKLEKLGFEIRCKKSTIIEYEWILSALDNMRKAAEKAAIEIKALEAAYEATNLKATELHENIKSHNVEVRKLRARLTTKTVLR